MSTIDIIIPCYNERDNVRPMVDEVSRIFRNDLPDQDWIITLVDNDSTDGTREIIQQLCASHDNVRAILNAKNFGPANSQFHALCQSDGDCTIVMACDFQEPPSTIPRFVKEWKNGANVVCGVKTKSKENPAMRLIRTVYYKLLGHMSSNVNQIEHFTGFGLYDSSFVAILNDLRDPSPFLRGIVAELAPNRVDIEYIQEKRSAGKSHYNFAMLFDTAMHSFTSYTKGGLRVATIAGFILASLSLIAALVYFVLKLMYWDLFPGGTIPTLLAVLIFGSAQLFFTGLVGEYVMAINGRVMQRPLVIEEARIGDWKQKDRA